MIKYDAQQQRVYASLFAEVYNSTIPKLADAKHVTIRIHPNRLSELSREAQDASEVVEMGNFAEGQGASTRYVLRVIAVPVSIHPQDGAEMVVDNLQDPTEIIFCVNGVPEVGLVNLRLNSEEQAAKDAASTKATADAKAADDKAKEDELEKAKAAAFEEGRKQALIDQDKAAGAASVKPAGETVQ